MNNRDRHPMNQQFSQYGGLPPGGPAGLPFNNAMQSGSRPMFHPPQNIMGSSSQDIQRMVLQNRAAMMGNVNQGGLRFGCQQDGRGIGQYGGNNFHGNQFPGNQFPSNQFPNNRFPSNQFLHQQMINMPRSWSPGCAGQQVDQYRNQQSFQRQSPGVSRSSSHSRQHHRNRRSPAQDSKECYKRRERDSRRESGRQESHGKRREKEADLNRRSPEKRSHRDERSRNRDVPHRKRACPGARGRASPAEALTWEEKGSRAVDRYLEGAGLVESSESEGEDAETDAWVRCSPADLYFTKDPQTGCTVATKRMQELERKFEERVLKRAEQVRASKPKVEPMPRKVHFHVCQHHSHTDDCSSSDASDSDDDPGVSEEMEWRRNHPERVHPDLWFNLAGEMNDGPLCKCSIKAKKFGIRHGIYPGEKPVPRCDPASNQLTALHHYRVVVSPMVNYQLKSPTIITYDEHQYTFEGFSLFSHVPLDSFPACKFIRFNMDYKVTVVKESPPENFSIRSLDLIHDFLYREILELVDEDWKGDGCGEGCRRFHIMPRFARKLPENGKEILSMNEVLAYLVKMSKPVITEMELAHLLKLDTREWQGFVDTVRGYIINKPGMRPSSIRTDNLDRSQLNEDVITYPRIIHFGKKPSQMSYLRDSNFMKAYKSYAKFRHLLALKPRLTLDDREKLGDLESKMNEIKMKTIVKRDVTVEQSCEGWMRTGLKTDITQHALMLPLLINHLRLHASLSILEEHLGYKFKDPYLLRLALTHPSQRIFYGMNPDHDRNSLSNCGLRVPEFGERYIFSVNSRKRGIIALLRIMSQMGYKEEKMSDINHNERLEFLGDAVVELLTTTHLYFMFPDSDEGVLTAYRSALVQNQHLAVLGRNLHIDRYMLYIHGPDLCHEADLKHAIANCFEAIMGALFIDGGYEVADRIFVRTLFEDEHLRQIWMDLPGHPLQVSEPDGDRHWIKASPLLQKLEQFEHDTGITFTHIRLLARAFTPKHIGFTNLTLGHNETMEFLGDSVLKLITSDYLFRHFPNHHEGHLSLLRSVLVNKNTQAAACDDLTLREYTIRSSAPEHAQAGVFTTKAKADLLESFIGALYVDKGMSHCEAFCNAVFFPRLKYFILTQEWNDPKSLLQQCCLSLRRVDEETPDMPIYKVVNQAGPTNTRVYTVAVYFRNKRLSKGFGSNIQTAEMNAAENALKEHDKLFPHQLLDMKYRPLLKKRKSAV